MNTEELKALGLSDEQIKKVMASYGKAINAEKEKQQAELQAKDDTIKARDKDLKDLKKTADEETLAKIAELQEKHKAELKEANDKAAKAMLEGKISEVLGHSKARNVDLLRKALNSEEISLNAEGQLIGLKEQISKLQETDAYLFDLGTSIGGTDPNSGKQEGLDGGIPSSNQVLAAFAQENRIIK